MKTAPSASEYVSRELVAGAGQDGFGLGAEDGQLLNKMRQQSLFPVPPLHGPVEARSGLAWMTQAVMSHRQEEEVEGVGLASARRETPFQNIDGFGVPARTIQCDAEGVEIHATDRVPSATACRAMEMARSGSRCASEPVANGLA